MKISPLRLGDITLTAPFFQAPLSGYSDSAMRRISREYGAPMSFGGLLLDKSTLHRKVMAKPLYAISPDEHPIGGQLLGSEPDIMGQAAVRLQEAGFDLIDLNFACPAPKVLNRQRGGYLLSHPDRVIQIYRQVRRSVNCPVTMKLRIGLDHSDEARAKFWQICQLTCDEGIDALIVHGRSVQQRYRDRADWDIIAQVKRRYPQTTIIGSGDLFTAEDIAYRLKSSGVDGVVIARGAIGNPWIFREARALIAGQPKLPAPDLAEQGRVLLRHFEMVRQLYEGRKAVIHFRKFSINYCRRHPQRKKAQIDLMAAQTPDELHTTVKKWYNL